MANHRRLAIALVLVLVVAWSASFGCIFKSSGKRPVSDLGTSRQGALTIPGADPPTLDPALAQDATSANYIVEIFSGLVTLNRKLEIEGDIAEKWDVSKDGKTYTFHLRSGAKFHDGKEVKAQDFKFSLERAVDPKLESVVADTYLGDIVGARDVLKGEAKQIRGVKVVDDRTLEITIDAPKAYFLAKLTYPTAFVVDEANVKKRNWTDTPNGTGPYKLKQWKKGEQILLERNADYYKGAPKLEKVNFLLSGGSSITMYENGEIDVSGVGLNDIERITDPTNPLNKELITSPSLDVFYIGFNTKRAPFDDPKVRQAFNHAVDKQKIADVVLKGMQTKADGILPPGMPGHNASLKGLGYDPDKARSLIAQSKYKDVANLPPIVLSIEGAGTNPPRTTTAIVEMWKQNLGVDVRIEQVEWATYLNDLKKHRFQMFEVGWIADYPDPQDFLDILFHSGSLDNNSDYSNPEVDSLLETARTEADVDKRLKLYQQAEQLIVNDAPWVPLFFTKSYLLVKPYVEGFVPAPMVIPFFKDVSLRSR
ncbi:MAG: peptide ABC transporter substrate-binding protein [Chloroflexi bacterium]|nr:peptide ABC transporter substrate-binding protein [Chloroflexota bacterium]